MSITIESSIKNYEVSFCERPDFLGGFSRYEPLCYAIDETVWNIYKDSVLSGIPDHSKIIVPIGEEVKTLESVRMLYDRLTGFSAKRNLTLISVGGGILQDISGFAASTLYRGINWIFVPTTLLAQADSCIGSKTSLNYEGFKNLIGTFYPPTEIFVCPEFLKTQKDDDFYSGLGEVVKLHIMDGPQRVEGLFSLFPEIIRREASSLMKAIRSSLAIKRGYIVEDEFDAGRRNLLNFGHCFGHALESTSRFSIPHGQAVVMGIVLSNIVSVRRGLLLPATHKRLLEKVLLPSLTVKFSKDFLDPESIIEGMKKDKKRTGNELALVMMDNDFHLSRVSDLTENEARQAITDALSNLDEMGFLQKE